MSEVCPICQKELKNKLGLSGHLRLAHGLSTVKDSVKINAISNPAPVQQIATPNDDPFDKILNNMMKIKQIEAMSSMGGATKNADPMFALLMERAMGNTLNPQELMRMVKDEREEMREEMQEMFDERQDMAQMADGDPASMALMQLVQKMGDKSATPTANTPINELELIRNFIDKLKVTSNQELSILGLQSSQIGLTQIQFNQIVEVIKGKSSPNAKNGQKPKE